MTAKNIRRVIAAVSLVVLLGCSMMHLAGCSSILGLPEDGPVQTMTPEEQSTRRVFTSPDGPADDAAGSHRQRIFRRHACGSAE